MKRILVIKLGALGDYMQALGPMAAIRKAHPDTHITLLTTKAFARLSGACPYCDAAWIDDRPKWYQPTKILQLRKTLNAGQFERVYDLQNNDRSCLYFQLMRPKPEWVGIAKGASHQNTSPERTAGQAFYGHAQTLSLAGIENVAIDPLEWIKPERTAKELGLLGPYVLIVPGSAPSRPDKRWPAAYYGALCQKLVTEGLTPVIIGTRDEEDAGREIISHCAEAHNLMGETSLFDLPALGRDAKAIIGNDTGPMHVMAPVGTPCLVLFSASSNPKRHAPIGDHVLCLQEDSLYNLDVETVYNAFRPHIGNKQKKKIA